MIGKLSNRDVAAVEHVLRSGADRVGPMFV